jgi:hypothetical protein
LKGVLLQAANCGEGIHDVPFTVPERQRTAERGDFGICTSLIQLRYSEDVVYKITLMVMQNVCDGFVLG